LDELSSGRHATRRNATAPSISGRPHWRRAHACSGRGPGVRADARSASVLDGEAGAGYCAASRPGPAQWSYGCGAAGTDNGLRRPWHGGTYFREETFSEVNSPDRFREHEPTTTAARRNRFREHENGAGAPARPRRRRPVGAVRRGPRRVHRGARVGSAIRADPPHVRLEGPPVPRLARRHRHRRRRAWSSRRARLGGPRLPHAPASRPQAQARDRQQRARRRRRPLHPPRPRTRQRRPRRTPKDRAQGTRHARRGAVSARTPEAPVAA
jgi:hypothetical protein